MTKHREPAERLANLAACYAAYEDWLWVCPFPDSQPFYETAGRYFDATLSEMDQLSQKLGDEALTESIQHFMDDGEMGSYESVQLFMRHIEYWARSKID